MTGTPGEVSHQQQSEQLTSWKQVAHYLGVSERTAQKWEAELGLPVYRSPGVRGRVRALPEELDAWLAGLRREDPNGAPQAPARKRLPLLIAASLTMVLVLGWWLLRPRLGEPAAWRIEGHTVVVTDARDREMWSHSLEPGWRFVDTRDARHGAGYALQLVDLDGDGRMELLAPAAEENGHHATRLLCFSPNGSLLWMHEPNETAHVPGRSYTGPWILRSVTPVPSRNGSGHRVFTTWSHLTHYPAFARLLDAAGTPQRTYWHAGHLANSRVIDFGDGAGPLIYVAAVANGYKQATLVVLDPDRFGGASREENESYQILGHAPPVEVARALFPQSRLSAWWGRYNTAEVLLVLDQRLLVEVVEYRDPEQNPSEAPLHYELGPRLEIKKLDYGDGMSHFYRLLAPAFQPPPGGLEAELAVWPPLRMLTPWSTQ